MLSLRHSGMRVNVDLTRRDPKHGANVLMPKRDERKAFLPEAVEEHAAYGDHAHTGTRDDQKIRARKTLAHSQNGIAVRPVDLNETRQPRELQKNDAKKCATEHASMGGSYRTPEHSGSRKATH